MPADDDAELFAVVDPDTGAPTGALLPRSVAHASGAWHRTVHVCVWAPDGRLLLQRRAAAKAVCPGAWDVSAAEHVRPGEACQAAAVRGLEEELGLVLAAAAQAPPPGSGGGGGGEHTASAPPPAVLTGPSPPGHRRSVYDVPPVLDREVVETWHVRGWAPDAPLKPDPAEVAEVRWVGLDALRAEVEADGGAGGRFTPWCLEQGRWQGWW